MRSPLLKKIKIGFIGAGNLTNAMVKGFLESQTLLPQQIAVSNRTPAKLQKIADQWGVKTFADSEELIEFADIVILAVKPQDLRNALEPLISFFIPDQVVVSVVAGVSTRSLEKLLPQCRIARLMPNTATFIRRGVLGYLTAKSDRALEVLMEDSFNPLGYVIRVEDEDQMMAITVAAASGTGFVLELMQYWQEWIEQHDIEPKVARKITVETFLGAALMASQASDSSLEDLQSKVTSKKGTTMAGLESMRELEIERALRYSFEKAGLRSQSLSKEFEG
jgi:pyrroline-5-carboxylate reductase